MKPKTQFQKMRDNRAKMEAANRRKCARVSLQWTEEEKEAIRRHQRKPPTFNMIKPLRHDEPPLFTSASINRPSNENDPWVVSGADIS